MQHIKSRCDKCRACFFMFNFDLRLVFNPSSVSMLHLSRPL